MQTRRQHHPLRGITGLNRYPYIGSRLRGQRNSNRGLPSAFAGDQSVGRSDNRQPGGVIVGIRKNRVLRRKRSVFSVSVSSRRLDNDAILNIAVVDEIIRSADRQCLRHVPVVRCKSQRCDRRPPFAAIARAKAPV